MFCYTVGIAARLQTIMIGYFLFFVEEDNVCVVAEHEKQPLPHALLPNNLNSLPGEFAVMSYIF